MILNDKEGIWIRIWVVASVLAAVASGINGLSWLRRLR